MSVIKQGMVDLQPIIPRPNSKSVRKNKPKIERCLSFSIPSSQVLRKEPKRRKIRSQSFDDFTVSSPLNPQISRRMGCPLSYAEESYGQKYQGLRMLERFIAGQEGVAVPPFKGISSLQMIEFIAKHEPQVLTMWTSLGDLYDKSEDKSAAFLKQYDVIEKLKTIRKLIKTLFEERADQLPFAEESAPWLAEMAARNSYLMVRSSGMEDGEKSANAGNNLSVPYVEPNLVSVSKAAGRVVASNFKLKSLKNLLDAKQNPFSAKLQLSFILQELIGEPLSGAKNDHEIPRSLVLFTSEPTFSEGPFSVMTLSTTFGHGESVVGNKGIACDRCYMTHSSIDPNKLVMSYQNGFKPTRLTPQQRADGSIVLDESDNTPHLCAERALDARMLERLFLLGKAVERSQGKPMDMELVIKGETIYLVQARPIIRQPAHPSFVAFNEKTEALFADAPIEAKRIVLGQASAIMIEHADEICIAPSLEEAEALYNPHKHKLVVVSRDENDNTHPWVNFSSLGVACLYHPNPKQVLSQLQKGPLIACPQSERFYVMTQGGKVEDVIEEGYVAHPARLSLSVAPTKPRRAINLPPEVRRSLMALKQARTEEVALVALEDISQSDLVKQAASLQGRAVARLEEDRLQAMEEVRAAFALDKPRLEKLYHIGRLESLLGQKYDALDSFSYVQLPAVIKEQQMEEAYQKKLPVRAQFSNFLPIHDLAPIEALGEEWVAFLSQLEQCAEDRQYLRANEEGKVDEEVAVQKIEKLKGIISLLQNTSSMPTWLVRVFAPAWQKANGSAAKCADLLLDERAGIDPVRIEWLQKFSTSLESIQKRGFQGEIDPAHKTFRKMADAARHQVFLDALRSGNKMEKLLALDSMKKVIENLDLYIKGIKANPALDEVEKLKVIRGLLEINKDVLWLWSTELFKEKELQLGEGWRLRRYFKEVIDDSFSKQENQYQSTHLAPSPGFSVQAATMGSQATYTRHLPMTTEDLFTLIHQNQLYLLSVLQKQISPLEDVCEMTTLPINFRETVMKTRSNPQSTFKNSYMGIEIDSQRIQVNFNVPMRNHSAILTLGIDKNMPGQYLLRCSLFGTGGTRGQKDSYYRMMKSHLRIFDLAKFLPLLDSSFQSTEQSLSFTWMVPYKKQRFATLCTSLMFFLLYEKTDSRWAEIVQKNEELREESVSMGKNYLTQLLQDPSLSPDIFSDYFHFLENLEIDYDDLVKQSQLDRDWNQTEACIANVVEGWKSSSKNKVFFPGMYKKLHPYWDGLLRASMNKLLAEKQESRFVNIFSRYLKVLSNFDSLFQIQNRDILQECFYDNLARIEKDLDLTFYKIWPNREDANPLINDGIESKLKESQLFLKMLAKKELLSPDMHGRLEQWEKKLSDALSADGFKLDPKIFQSLAELLP